MNDLNLFLAENPNFKIVSVSVDGSRKTFKTMLDVQADDTVVVRQRDALRVGQVIVTVPGLEADLSYATDPDWLISVVSLAEYDKMYSMQQEVNKKFNVLQFLKRRKELMDEFASEIGEDSVKAIQELVRL